MVPSKKFPKSEVELACIRRQSNASLKKIQCKYFSLGKCRYGSQCRFSHEGKMRYPYIVPSKELVDEVLKDVMAMMLKDKD